MDTIFKRRSVRKYLDKPVEDAQITQLLKAAMRAPSAGNEQPWEFVVLSERDTMVKIMEFHPYAKMLQATPCVIVVCANLQRSKFPEYDYWVQDCSAAAQNLLLEAWDLGLGATWLGVYPIPERVQGMQALLKLPGHVVPLCAVTVGHPAEVPPPADTFDEERIHREQW